MLKASLLLPTAAMVVLGSVALYLKSSAPPSVNGAEGALPVAMAGGQGAKAQSTEPERLPSPTAMEAPQGAEPSSVGRSPALPAPAASPVPAQRRFKIFATETKAPDFGTTAGAIWHGLLWLEQQQAPDGSWGLQVREKQTGEPAEVQGPSEYLEPVNGDVTATSLALLAMVADRQTMTRGRHKIAVQNGVKWLLNQQDRGSGRLSQETAPVPQRAQAIATLALSEIYRIDKSILIKRRVERSIAHLAKARQAGGPWAYEAPMGTGFATWDTGWAACALGSARLARLEAGDQALAAIADFIEESTDPTSGPFGRQPNRPASVAAASLFAIDLAGRKPSDHQATLGQHAAQWLSQLPTLGSGDTLDLGFLFYSTFALNRLPARHADDWNLALQGSLLGAQANGGNERGSWAATGPIGSPCGSRVTSTALAVLCLAATQDKSIILR